jgi:hypothetical protein
MTRDDEPSTCAACKKFFASGLSVLALHGGKYMCPACVAKAPAIAPPASSRPDSHGKLTSCTACGGTVSLAANSCPHCGHPSPAPATTPKQPTKVTKKHLIIAGVVLLLFFIGAGNRQDPMTGTEAARVCAREAGIDPDSGQSVSMKHLRDIDTCLNRLGFKTR